MYVVCVKTMTGMSGKLLVKWRRLCGWEWCNPLPLYLEAIETLPSFSGRDDFREVMTGPPLSEAPDRSTRLASYRVILAGATRFDERKDPISTSQLASVRKDVMQSAVSRGTLRLVNAKLKHHGEERAFGGNVSHLASVRTCSDWLEDAIVVRRLPLLSATIKDMMPGIVIGLTALVLTAFVAVMQSSLHQCFTSTNIT